MVTVTYQELAQLDVDYPGVTSRIEAYTGSRQTYGLNTPIDVLDIIDNVGLDDGVLALAYAVPDTTALCQTLAIECLKASMLPWDAVFPGNSRLRDFLHDVELYLETKTTPVTPKVDYCGDPIPGFYGVIPLGQLTDKYDSMKASSDTLSLIGTYYARSFWMTSAAPFTQAAIDYWQASDPLRVSVDSQDRNSTDYATILAQPLSDYPVQNIIAVLTADPDYYFKQSAQFGVQLTPGYTYYGIIIHRSIDNGQAEDPVSYEHLAVQMLLDQLSQLIDMVVYDVNLLPSIIVGIRSYMLQYETERRLQLGVIMPRLQELQTAGAFPNKTHNPVLDAYEQAIIDSGLNQRAQLLRDVTYLSNFDADLSGTIDAVERAAMENDMRSQMKLAREATANAFLTVVESEYNALGQLSSGQRITDVLTTYLL
jgi:hypothetical protein